MNSNFELQMNFELQINDFTFFSTASTSIVDHIFLILGPIGFASVGSLAYSSIFPSTSVMVNWHQQGCLTHLKDQWLIDAAVRLNPKLRLSPKCQQVRT